MTTSKDGATIALLAQQAVASPSGRRFVAKSVRSIIRGRVERRTIVRRLGATIYGSGAGLCCDRLPNWPRETEIRSANSPHTNC
jgi:hypothetical protein